MKRFVQGGLMVALIATLAACQPGEPATDEAQRGIEDVREMFIDAYNRHDAAAVAGLFTPDAVFVNPQGMEISGRDQIQQELDRFFQATRPQLTATADVTESNEQLGWEMGTYQLQLQQPTAQPQLGEPAELGTEPRVGEPAATGQPGTTGQPGITGQPGQPPIGAQPQSEEGHYLIVLEQEVDGWLIRAHVAHAGSPTGAMPPQQPVTTPATPGLERPLQPATPADTAAEEPVRTQPAETAPPAATPEPDAGAEADEDDLEPPPEDGDAAPGR